MSVARRRFVLVACFFFLIAPHVDAELPTIPQEVERAVTYFTAAGYYTEIPGMFSSHTKCIARGFSSAICNKAVATCAINEAAGTVFGRISVLMDVFQVDCGNGICFACCFTGERCHTSFYSEDYKPVLNCGPDYGPGTRQAGPTIIVDPDAKPGDACLFTGQSCDHLPLCVSGKSPADIERINNDPRHIMKSAAAVNSRARTYATATLANWSSFLSGYHTSSPEQSDSIRQKVHDFAALSSFVTGRGCVGWRHSLPDWFAKDWDDPQFRIEDTNGLYAEEASHLNGIRQLGVAQLVTSIPNLYNRLAYVESRVWTPDAIEQYLAPIGDPDVAFLRTMSPIALEILKKNRQLQDYRLLAVPLAGETVPPRLYNGCMLGDPPVVQLSYQKKASLGIDLRIAAADSANSSALEVETLVLWGDGSITRLTIPPGGAARTVSHDYAAGARYQVLVIAQNDSGLRTIGALVAQTAGTGTNPAAAPMPIFSEIQLVDLRATMDSFAGNTMTMLLELEGWLNADEGYALGISRALPLPLEQSVRFGTIAGWNVGAAPLQSVTIRPSRYGAGILLGFKKHYFTLDRLRVGVYSTHNHRLRYYDIPVTAEMVRLYPEGSTSPVALTQPTYGADGRLQIPVQVGGVRYARVDLLFPASTFVQAVQGPVLDSTWTGVVGTRSETIPLDELPVISRRRAVGHR